MTYIAENTPPRWRFKHANWELFRQSVSLSLPSIHEQSLDISTLNAKVTASLLKAAKISIPFSSGDRANKNPVPWWNKACETAIRKKKAAYRKMRRTFAAQDIILFKKCRAKCRKIILNAKKTCWRKFCESLGKHEQMGKVWRMAKSFSGGQKSFPIPKLTLDQNVASSASENASLLALIFSETSRTTNYSTCFIRRKLEFERNTPPLIPFHIESPDPINQPFSMRELKRAINSKKQSATGVDEISYVMLKHLGDENLEVILH